TEPLPADDPLTALENVTLTAHAAWNTPDADRNLMQIGFNLARAPLV
ncbi:MAG TPA: 3-phosphoglycerate dehydrogenase, partial [Rhodospirillaceae bacterium]|nr:3-phosphoglycerate dehydrogenase [Rhodospirillaceae bacterium]